MVNKVRVTIAGAPYAIATTDTENYITTLAKKLDVECIALNAEALAGQDAEAARFAALLTAADKLGIQYIGSSRRARLEVGTDGVHTVLPPVDAARDDSTALAALPQETLGRLILPLGDFSPEDVAEMAAE